MTMNTPSAIHVRSDLDFRFANLPRYWYRGDPFISRMMDALLIIFPEGEKYLITSVRHFRDRITDPVLAKEVADFIRQEAQHALQQEALNRELVRQGVPIEPLTAEFRGQLDTYLCKLSPEVNLATTAAIEHMTALMAELMFGDPEKMCGADPHVRAMLLWHCIEEMEHRTVAFDVMTKVARIGYFKRTLVMTLVMMNFWRLVAIRVNRLLAADGFTVGQRWKMMFKGLPRLFGHHGMFRGGMCAFMSYFKPGFHPDQMPVFHRYGEWVAQMQAHGDPVEASEALFRQHD